MRDGESKVLLKQLFAKYFPAKLRLIKKHYFNIPLSDLLAENNFEIIRTSLAREMILRHNLVDPEKAGMWLDRYMAGDGSLMFKVWALLVLHAWLDARRAEGSELTAES